MHLNAIIKSIAGGASSAHAYIVEAKAGGGREEFIKKLSMGLECRSSDVSSRPCGHCDACRQAAAGSSMDIVHMQMSGKNGYRTEDANAFSSRLDMGAYGRYLIGIIDDADSLSETVQNGFLRPNQTDTGHITGEGKNVADQHNCSDAQCAGRRDDLMKRPDAEGQ